jgi:hypothetical protein
VPKIFGKEVNPIILAGGVAILGFLIYDGLFPAEPTASSSSTRSTKKKTPAKADKGGFLPEDYEAKFASYSTPVRNSFTPLVAKKAITPSVPAGGGVAAGPSPYLSGALTGGEGNWMYTGYAEVDGVRQGLLENSSTSESVFLRPGQKWKQLVVRTIGAEKMVVTGPDGASVTLPVGDIANEQKANPNVVPPGGVVPVNPGGALRGQIGGTAAQIPGDPNVNVNSLQVQPDGTMGSMENNDGGRRRGGNRRGRRQG